MSITSILAAALVSAPAFTASTAHANTETLVGHATPATGADPSAHGMIGISVKNRGSHTGPLIEVMQGFTK